MTCTKDHTEVTRDVQITGISRAWAYILLCLVGGVFLQYLI